MTALDRPLSAKELAAALGVCPGYVSAMRECGFPRRRALLCEAVEWLRANPFFRVRQAWKRWRGRRVKVCDSL